LPHADQVADRWHLMENASRAFLDAVGKSMRQIRKAVGSAIIDPELLTYAERLQYEGYLRRQETNEAILELSKQGVPIKQIVKRTGYSRKLVRSVLRGQRSDVFRVRQSSLEAWLPWLDSRWEQSARNASALWREMRKKGFRGQIGVVSEWADQSALARTPSARSIARLMTLARDDLSKSDAVLIAAIENNIPDLVTARTLIDDFQQMIRSKAVAKLDAWLEGAKASLVGSFANSVQKDIAAVRNAIISPWSNGQTEGQITKLKLIKRQMYGRAKIDLLQARLVGATWAVAAARVRQSPFCAKMRGPGSTVIDTGIYLYSEHPFLIAVAAVESFIFNSSGQRECWLGRSCYNLFDGPLAHWSVR
jgi:transposase